MHVEQNSLRVVGTGNNCCKTRITNVVNILRFYPSSTIGLFKQFSNKNLSGVLSVSYLALKFYIKLNVVQVMDYLKKEKVIILERPLKVVIVS